MSKKGEQKYQDRKVINKQRGENTKAEESINIAQRATNDYSAAKSLSKSSQKQKPVRLSSPLIIKEVQQDSSPYSQAFPEPDQYNVLKMSGILDAYQHFLKLLCKHGLPTGRVYEYAAQEIEKYQKRKLNKQLKMRAQLDILKIKKAKGEPSPEKPFHPQVSPYLQH